MDRKGISPAIIIVVVVAVVGVAGGAILLTRGGTGGVVRGLFSFKFTVQHGTERRGGRR